MAKTEKKTAPPREYAGAVDKVRDEMAAAKGANAQAVRAIGEMLTEWLLKHPEDDGKVMQRDRALDGCYFEMEKYARAHKTGSSYCMTPDEAFGMIRKYFGIEGNGGTEGTGTSSARKTAQSAVFSEMGPAGPSEQGTGKGPSTPLRSAQDDIECGARREAARCGAEAQTSTVAAPEPDPFDLDALLASGPAGLSPSDPEDSPGETRDRAPCATDAGREMGGAL